jgi:hypothetical protein
MYSAPAISLGEKWWRTVLKRDISCSQLGRLSMNGPNFMNGPIFLFLTGWVEMEFFVFSPYSQNVPIKFSSSQSVPKCVLQDVPNSTWILSHMVCPKYNSHVYYLNRWYIRKDTCFHFAIGVQRGASIWGMPHVPINWWWGNQYGSLKI